MIAMRIAPWLPYKLLRACFAKRQCREPDDKVPVPVKPQNVYTYIPTRNAAARGAIFAADRDHNRRSISGRLPLRVVIPFSFLLL